jgi:hypothetical protein
MVSSLRETVGLDNSNKRRQCVQVPHRNAPVNNVFTKTSFIAFDSKV